MKKIITSLLANFAVVTLATQIMANQVTSQEIENMRTKVDFWIEKTANWRNYVDEEFAYKVYNSSNDWYLDLFNKNMLDPNFDKIGYYQRIEYMGNYPDNPAPNSEKKWFDCKITYYPDRVVDLNCHVSRWNPTNILIKEFKMNDYQITTPENKNYFPLTSEYNKIFVKTLLNNGNLDIQICFFYQIGWEEHDRPSLDNQHRYHITTNHSPSTKINIKINGTIIYKIREAEIQKLHNKLLSIKQQLNNPNLAQDAYKTHLSFMNLEN